MIGWYCAVRQRLGTHHFPLRVSNLQVYDVGVDTILLAFCEDCEKNDGNPQYAPALLMKAIGKQAKINEGKIKKGGEVAATA